MQKKFPTRTAIKAIKDINGKTEKFKNNEMVVMTIGANHVMNIRTDQLFCPTCIFNHVLLHSSTDSSYSTVFPVSLSNVVCFTLK